MDTGFLIRIFHVPTAVQGFFASRGQDFFGNYVLAEDVGCVVMEGLINRGIEFKPNGFPNQRVSQFNH